MVNSFPARTRAFDSLRPRQWRQGGRRRSGERGSGKCSPGGLAAEGQAAGRTRQRAARRLPQNSSSLTPSATANSEEPEASRQATRSSKNERGSEEADTWPACAAGMRAAVPESTEKRTGLLPADHLGWGGERNLIRSGRHKHLQQEGKQNQGTRRCLPPRGGSEHLPYRTWSRRGGAAADTRNRTAGAEKTAGTEEEGSAGEGKSAEAGPLIGVSPIHRILRGLRDGAGGDRRRTQRSRNEIVGEHRMVGLAGQAAAPHKPECARPNPGGEPVKLGGRIRRQVTDQLT